MMMAVWKFAPALAAGNTVVLKPSRHHAGDHAAAGRDGRRGPAAGRASTSSPATATPAARSSSTRRPTMVVDHRLGAGRHGGRRAAAPRTSSGCTSSSAARRRSSSSTTPTSRPRPRARRRRLLQRRPGLHRGHPRARRPRDPRRLRRGARRAGAKHATTFAGGPTTTTPSCGRSTTPASSTGCSGFLDRTPDHADVVAGGVPVRATGAASSSSRPSSPACTRTTR